MSTLEKIKELLSPSQRRSALVLFGFMLLGMALETLSVSLVIPVIALLTEADTESSSVGRRLIDWMGHSNQTPPIVAAMLTLTAIYLLKTVFLTFLAWW